MADTHSHCFCFCFGFLINATAFPNLSQCHLLFYKLKSRSVSVVFLEADSYFMKQCYSGGDLFIDELSVMEMLFVHFQHLSISSQLEGLTRPDKMIQRVDAWTGERFQLLSTSYQ